MLMFCNCEVIRKVAGGHNLEPLSEHDFIVLLEERTTTFDVENLVDLLYT